MNVTFTKRIGNWVFLTLTVGMMAGLASYVFLTSLDLVTQLRESNRVLIGLLPFAGFLSGWIYLQASRVAHDASLKRDLDSGNALIFSEVTSPTTPLPFRVAPLVLVGTLLTHLFGGSAGREGTAVQMGAVLADQLSRWFRFARESRPLLIRAGISAGFASVFGTPLAGVVFAFEVVSPRGMGLSVGGVIVCVLASYAGHVTATTLGVVHTEYSSALIGQMPGFTLDAVVGALLGGIIFGVVAFVFSGLTARLKAAFVFGIAYAPLRLFVGGAMIASAALFMNNMRYLGLGIPTILESFQTVLPPSDFSFKLLFTALTLGAGFKGGEVTPLFFIGATLGSTLSGVGFFSLPLPVLAALGLVGVFAGAFRTPLAAVVLAGELFGFFLVPLALVSCMAAQLIKAGYQVYINRVLRKSPI